MRKKSMRYFKELMIYTKILRIETLTRKWNASCIFYSKEAQDVHILTLVENGITHAMTIELYQLDGLQLWRNIRVSEFA